MYGVTTYGGNNACHNGCGTLFYIDPNGNYQQLYKFTGASDGANPVYPLTVGGYEYGFFGTTSSTIFNYNLPRNTLNVVHSFNQQNDGAFPSSKIFQDGAFFYGTTYFGGVNNGGIVYRINYDGSNYIKIHEFGGNNDINGSNPIGDLVIHRNTTPATPGDIFGVTAAGGNNFGGVLYEITSDNKYIVLYNFSSFSGRIPKNGITQGIDNLLYGTLNYNALNGKGSIFTFSPEKNIFNNLYNFSSEDGAASSILLQKEID